MDDSFTLIIVRFTLVFVGFTFFVFRGKNFWNTFAAHK